MNKNSKRRHEELRQEMKKNGGWPKPGFKKKIQQFPTPNKDIDMSLKRQREIFYGV